MENNHGPQVGQVTKVRGVVCRISKVHPFGTIDVEEIDGLRAWRITGLMVGDDDPTRED